MTQMPLFPGGAPRPNRSPGIRGAPPPRPAGTKPRIIRPGESAGRAPLRSGRVRAARPERRAAGERGRESYEQILQRLNARGFLHDDDFASTDALERAFARADMDAVHRSLIWSIWEEQNDRFQAKGAKVSAERVGREWRRRVTLPNGQEYRPAAAARRLGMPEAVAFATPRPRMLTSARVTETGRVALAGGGAYKPRRAVREAERRGLINRTPTGRFTIPGVRGAYKRTGAILDALEKAPRPR